MTFTPLTATALALGAFGIGVGVGLLARRHCARTLGNRIPCGRAAGKKPWQFDPGEFVRGMKVEMEHTNDWCVAGEIAIHHLTEDRRYYEKLLKAGL